MPIDFADLPTRVTPPDVRTRDQIIASIAYHEAGHAIIGMTFGMSLARLRVHTIDVDGYMGWTGTTTWNNCYVPHFQLAVELAAGEAAEKRWMTRTGTPTHIAARLAASPHDRDMAISALARSNYTVTFDGTEPADPATGTSWARAMAAADHAVEEAWQQITATAEALIAVPRRELTGAEVATLTGTTNAAPAA
ncbi:hypothetical protein [Streptomyces scabiei]|uniref:hypothetical protein n=1 Tax=Streptomyces scabiei TaxID=1930 RepID=UPI0029A54987|nr:hypothetical protein [Streptomyces scabiei]MDX3279072.1 hypothetical protein [Streptomyces scabiei]MDX3279075.1 hypothetical protein [Streptomyces scabiei]